MNCNLDIQDDDKFKCENCYDFYFCNNCYEIRHEFKSYMASTHKNYHKFLLTKSNTI